MANPPQQKGLAPKPKAPAPATRLEYPKTDWANMGWGEVGSRALKNMPSSAWTAIKGLNPVNILTGTGGLIVGALRKAGMRDDPNRDPAVIAARKGGDAWSKYYQSFGPKTMSADKYRQQVLTQVQNRIRAGQESEKMFVDMYNMYGKRYGSMAGFKEALATDPISVIMDFNTATRAGGAGLRLGAKGSGMGAKVAAGAEKYVTAPLSKATDPFNIAITGTKAAAKLAGKGVGLVKKVPESRIFANGQFTPAAQAALKGAFPNLTKADLSNPTLQRAMIETMSSRGITPAAARQALATHHNITIPTSRLTGKAPRRAPTAQQTKQVTKEAQTGIQGAVAQNFPHKNEDIGIRLKEAETNARDVVDQQYTAARQIAGEFDPGAAKIIEDNINAAIQQAYPQYKSANLPANTFPQGMEVIDDFRTNLPKEAGEHGLTMGLLDDKRHGILKRYRGDGAAAGRDRHLLGVIQDGFDKGIEAAIQQGMFKGDSADLLKTWGQARASNAAYRNNFSGTDRFGNPDLVSQALAMADKGNFDKAGNFLINGMFDPQTGAMIPDAPRVWEQIHAVDPTLGATVDSGVRRMVADQVATGKIDVPTANTTMSAFSANGKSAFTPEQQATVRQVGELKGTLDTTPSGKESPTLDTAKRMAGSAGTGAIVGYGLSGATGLPPQVTAPTVGAIQAVGREAYDIARGPSVELSGVVPAQRARPYEAAIPAKTPLGVEVPAQVGVREEQSQEEAKRQSVAAQNVGPTTQIAPPGQPTGDVEETMSFEQPVAAQPAGIDENDLVIGDIGKPQRATGGRVAYATGGKIKKAGHDHLVQRLMNKAKHAKRQTDSTTKPLLNVDDAAIVRALSVAQRGV